MKRYNPTQTTPFSFKQKMAMRLWNIVWLLLFRPTPWMMYKWRVVLLRIFGGKISWRAKISNSAKVDCPWNLVMEDYSSLGDGAWAYALDRITIKKWSCVGKGVQLITGSHDVKSLHFDLITAPIVIHEGGWIATDAVVLQGVDVGRFCVVGACSLVIQAMPENMVCVGVPARPLRLRFEQVPELT